MIQEDEDVLDYENQPNEQMRNYLEEDAIENQLSILNTQIADASRTLSSLIISRDKLSKKFLQLENKFNSLEAENERLSSAYVETPTNLDTIRKHGTFFQQLRALEIYEDRLKNRVIGLQAANRSYSDNIKAANAKVQSLQKQRDALIIEAENIESMCINQKDELTRLQTESNEASSQANSKFLEAEKLKKVVQERSKELQSISSEDLVNLQSQCEILSKELESEREHLASLLRLKKSDSSLVAAQENLRIKKTALDKSPQRWISQRTSLIARIRKARQELLILDNRDRSSSRMESKAVEGIDENEIKRAILLEIKQIKQKDDRFQQLSIQTEKNYSEQLIEKLKELELTTKKLTQFKFEADELLNEQKEQADREDFINLLKIEYESIRKNA